MLIGIKDWQFIARYMKMLGYSTAAITETLGSLGHFIAARTVRDCLNLRTYQDIEIPSGYPEFRDSIMYELPPIWTEPIGLEDVIELLIGINQKYISPGSEDAWRDSSDSSAYSREYFSPDDVSQCESDYGTGGFLEVASDDAEELSSDSFSYWNGDSHKTGLKRYLDYERRSNSSAEILEGYDD